MKRFFLTTLLLSSLAGISLGVGYLLGGQTGLLLGLAVAFVMNFGTYFFSHKIVLGMHRAKELSSRDNPELYQIVQQVARLAKVPQPRLYWYQDNQPNAFATGRNPANGIVAVSSGLLELLDTNELRGVVAHEVAHIKNRDTLISTLTATLAGSIAFVAEFSFGLFSWFVPNENEDGPHPTLGILLAIITPIIGSIVQLAISRQREYLADHTAARWLDDGSGLASALQKLSLQPAGEPAVLTQSVSHLYIVHPSMGALGNLFSTHPPVKERIRRLQSYQ